MRLRYTSLCLALLFCIAAAGQSVASSVADNLQKKYTGISSMRANFTQVLLHKESGAREKRNGVLSFKKTLLVLWETQKPSPEILLVAQDCIWNAFPDEEIAYKYSLDLAKDSRNIISVVTGQSRLDQDFYLEEEGADGGFATLRLYPKEPVQSMVEVLLWIDPKTFLIHKVRIYDFYGNENEIAFSRHEIGVALKDSVFSYKPPKDFVVEDRTQDSAAAPKNL